MDQSIPISEVKKLLFWYDKGFDAVIGSRGFSRKGNTLVRKVASLIFLSIRRLFLLRDICDTQCGFKLFKRKTILKTLPFLQCFKESDEEVVGWKATAYDIELLYFLKKLKYDIKEVNVDCCDRDLSITKKNDTAKSFFKGYLIVIKEILLFFFNIIKGTYKKK